MHQLLDGQYFSEEAQRAMVQGLTLAAPAAGRHPVNYPAVYGRSNGTSSRENPTRKRWKKKKKC